MKVREFRIQVFNRMGTRILDSVTRDRTEMLHTLDRQTVRADMDVASFKVDVKIVENNLLPELEIE